MRRISQYQNIIMSLLQTQREALQPILDPAANGASPWKVIVFDTGCQNILSTLYKVGDLRELCITLHLNINQKREKLHGVRVIYLLQATQENILKLIDDFQKDLYSQVIINFSSPIPDLMLDHLAKSNISMLWQDLSKIPGAAQKVEKVYDHNIHFTSLNHNLYTFNIDNVYSTLVGQKKQQSAADIQSQLVTHLSALIATMKVTPVVIYQSRKTKAANSGTTQSQVVGQLLIQKLQIDHEDKPTAAVLLLERDDDLNYSLQHSSTYAALMHDIFHINNNKLNFQGEKGVVQYDLSPLTDTLWAQAFNLPYPQATELIDNQLNSWKQEYEKVIGEQDGISSMLSSALDVVPQLQQQKKTIDQHVNIASQILQHAKQRQLDKYYQCGLAITQQQPNYIQSVKELFQTETSPEYQHLQEIDRTRLLILLILNGPQNCQFYEDYTKLEQMAGIKNPELKKSINYIKEKVHFATQNTQQNEQSIAQNDLKSIFKGIASKVKSHSKGILQNVSNLLPPSIDENNILEEKRCAVVSIIETLFDDFKQQELLDFFKVYDCRKQQYIMTENIQLSHINDIIVCVLEGGSLNEYAELCEFAKMQGRNIIYGGSQILNAEDILNQFQECVE